jgi:hypothetical protein
MDLPDEPPISQTRRPTPPARDARGGVSDCNTGNQDGHVSDIPTTGRPDAPWIPWSSGRELTCPACQPVIAASCVVAGMFMDRISRWRPLLRHLQYRCYRDPYLAHGINRQSLPSTVGPLSPNLKPRHSKLRLCQGSSGCHSCLASSDGLS